MNLQDLKKSWVDDESYHKYINEAFKQNVDADETLNSHRTWVTSNTFGFGEDSFWWLWKLLCVELPENPALLELGVFRAATLSLWKLLRPDAKVFGVTPLDSSGGVWESDYEADIATIHEQFSLPKPHIFKGSSLEPAIIKTVSQLKYDCVYVDGIHTYDGCYSDLVNYAPLVKQGGYLVIDDACNDMHMPFGFFQGIDTVTNATLDYMKENGNDWGFITNMVHLRIYKRK